ncbi:E3 ubiquitin-protein ligase BRE1A-like [Cucumis melo var. makuwa]|uniref:E3 ubiquitin-protein ligase BRE1A-like n=1 Tax=Cucumis melo var. makuwa TaxID=1194695 RepID=A0A5A7SS70_CUCMM|nr:E3 ubiquitin-protein ligase BRE1A-like [Cucumis melo var. makuwa]TYK02553.1 E3 ubiquitin-protein ligase BRE1A-like [Cucumis melo var. makuwa]
MTKVSAKKPQLPAPFPPTLNQLPDLDLHYKPGSSRPTRRRIRSPARVRRVVAPVGKRSRPETPLLKWKVDDPGSGGDGVQMEEDEKKLAMEKRQRGRFRGSKGRKVVVSARKLAAGIWRLQLQEAVASEGRNGGDQRRTEDLLGFQPRNGHSGVSAFHPDDKIAFNSEMNDLLHSPHSVSDSRNGRLCKFEPSFRYLNSAMEGATKWEPACLKTSVEARQIYNQMRLVDQQGAVSALSALEAELEQAHLRIEELQAERNASKKKLEYFLRKVSEEKALWRSREHEKVRAFIDDIKAELNREKKTRQRVEMINSKLVNELADAKLSAKRFMQDCEKERKERSLVEEVCDELAKEIGEDKARIESLKRETLKLRDEVDEERRMLQMAEVWREERVQMKLVDAKVALEEKYSQMRNLVADLEDFLRLRSETSDVSEMKKALLLREAAATVNIQDVTEFVYEPSNPDDIFSVFEDVNFGESNEREIGQCITYSPPNHASKVQTASLEANMTDRIGIQKHTNSFIAHNGIGDIEEDESGWETVSHLEDQGSSNSPEESIASVTKNRRESNASVSGTEWEGNGGGDSPVTEISEVCSVPSKQLKKISSIARLWKSCSNNEGYKLISLEGINARLSNGRLSSASILSADGGSVRSGISPPELTGQWSSPDSGNGHATRGKKGCIPRNTIKGSLKAKLLEARMESHKVQLRQVLKQKI